MTELCDMAIKHDTDKGTYWGYTATYFEWLKDRRDTIQTVLEVGVFRGASLRTWRDFFPGANVYGVDIDHGSFEDIDSGRIATLAGDAYDQTFLGRVFEKCGPVDFMVDDCVHHADRQIPLLQFSWPHIRSGGIYAIEEVHNAGKAAVQAAINCLPGVVRIETRYFRDDYSLALVQKGDQ